MEIMLRESADMSASLDHHQMPKGQESALPSQDFEKIDSLETSYENATTRERKISLTNYARTISPASLREETYFEKIRNFGTNLKFGFDALGQGGWLESNKKACIYLLGDKYESDEGDKSKDIVASFSNILWFSYRKNFPKLIHKKLPATESYISDTGWGCMIRVCQMMFAECLKRCYISQQIRNQEENKQNNEELDMKALNIKVASWFLDYEANPNVAPYSIQNISSYIYDKFQTLPGVWLKPSMVLFALQKMHKDYCQFTIPQMDLEIYLEGTIYLPQTIKRMTSTRSADDETEHGIEKQFEIVEDEDQSKILIRKNSLKKEIKLRKSSSEAPSFESYGIEDPKDLEKLFNLKWTKSLVIYLLAKIGIEKPNPEYHPFIKELLSYPESVGMIGGKPGFAYYIVGHNKDKLIYLDPHFVQEAVRSKEDLQADFSTYSCDKMRYIGLGDIDTSVAFGFFIQDETSFKEFIQRFSQSCEKKESFLGLELSILKEDSGDFESVGEDDEDFEMVFVK